MNLLLLLCCCLPSLCLSYQCAADECYSSKQLGERFLLEHTEFSFKLNCDDLMNRMRQKYHWIGCKSCHTVITADHNPKSLASELENVCSGESGYRVSWNFFQSYKSFRLITCWNIDLEGFPKTCRYLPYPAFKPITLNCKDGFPVHFDKCHGEGEIRSLKRSLLELKMAKLLL